MDPGRQSDPRRRHTESQIGELFLTGGKLPCKGRVTHGFDGILLLGIRQQVQVQTYGILTLGIGQDDRVSSEKGTCK